MKKIIAFALALALSGCADTNLAHDTLAAKGFTNIKVLGPSIYGCSRSNFYVADFEAVTPNGKKVKGQVCNDAVGGSDIHIDW